MDALLLMKKILSCCLISVMLIGGACYGCSDKKEAPEKGAIRKMTEETAKEAVNRIRTPIDKARSVAQQQEDKAKEMVDAVKN